MKITLDLDKEWNGFISRISKIKTSGISAAYKAMELSLIFLEARIKESVRKNFRKTLRTSGGKLGIAAQGRLSTNWGREIGLSGNTLIGQVGTMAKHARIHEFGGTIKPTHSKALTIPMTTRAYPPAHELKAQGKVFINRGKGNKFVFLKQKGGAVPIYVLKNSVKMPKRPFVAPVIAQWGSKISEIFGSEYFGLFTKK